MENKASANNNQITLKTISLKDLWNVLRGCLVFVIIAAVLSTGIAYVWAKVNYVPRYTSTATVYLVGDYEGEFDVTQFASDYNVAVRIINECIIMIKSRTVLNNAGTALGMAEGKGYGTLNSVVTVTNPEDTRVIYISATANSPKDAKAIVDAVCQATKKGMNDMYAYDQFHVFEEGTLPSGPSNSISLTSYLKYGLIAGVLVYLVFLAMFLFDNYIHSEDDIEKYLGLTILGDIPDANAPDKRKKKYTNYKGYSPNGQSGNNKNGRKA